MVSLVQRFRHWLAGEAIVYEYQNSGTTLDEHQTTYSTCGAGDVVCYTLD